jgi:hypothetical protein
VGLWKGKGSSFVCAVMNATVFMNRNNSVLF